MTDQLPEEVFIVGYRYRDNADDVSKLFKLNRPIEKNDVILALFVTKNVMCGNSFT